MSVDPNVVVPGMAPRTEPVAARLLTESRELEIEFNTGMRCRWPVDSLQFTHSADDYLTNIEPRPTDEQLAEIELWPSGEVVEFVSIEQGFEIAALMRGELGSKRWMNSLLKDKPSLYLAESISLRTLAITSANTMLLSICIDENTHSLCELQGLIFMKLKSRHLTNIWTTSLSSICHLLFSRQCILYHIVVNL